MLLEFEELKVNLSIVNKSFVTLGKPLRYEQTFVYIRDTMLLAPAGKASLAGLGKLSAKDGEFSKREISYEDITNKGKFLKRDKNKNKKLLKSTLFKTLSSL
jgi:hypothetical protein